MATSLSFPFSPIASDFASIIIFLCTLLTLLNVVSLSQQHSSELPRLMVLRNHWSESHSVVSNSLWPHGLYSPWNSPGQNTGMGSPSPSPGNLSNPGMEPRSPAVQADSVPTEPPGKSESLLNLRSPLTQGCITVSRAAAYRAHLGFMGCIWSRQVRGKVHKRGWCHEALSHFYMSIIPL